MANSNVKKVTKKDNYKELMTYVPTDRQDLVDFINHEIELLDRKKSNGNSKANKQVADNVELVYNALASVGKAVTVTELIAQSDLSALANEEHIVTTQRVRAYIGKLIESGRVKSYKDKKRTLFEIVVTETDTDND
jgi:hypothetical protein